MKPAFMKSAQVRVMAFSGQTSWQQKHVMQVSASTTGIASIIVSAWTGH